MHPTPKILVSILGSECTTRLRAWLSWLIMKCSTRPDFPVPGRPRGRPTPVPGPGRARRNADALVSRLSQNIIMGVGISFCPLPASTQFLLLLATPIDPSPRQPNLSLISVIHLHSYTPVFLDIDRQPLSGAEARSYAYRGRNLPRPRGELIPHLRVSPDTNPLQVSVELEDGTRLSE